MKAQQNILVTIFDVSTEAYKAFTELKAYKSNAETLIAQALLIKKENSVITTVDSLDQGEQISGGAGGYGRSVWCVAWRIGRTCRPVNRRFTGYGTR
jgi:hypothetical protein